MKLNRKKGFTLVELIIVIAILGILAAILVSSLTPLMSKAKLSKAQTTVKYLNDALDRMEAKGFDYATIREYGEINPSLLRAELNKEGYGQKYFDDINEATELGYYLFFADESKSFELATEDEHGMIAYAEGPSHKQDYMFPHNNVIQGKTFMNYSSNLATDVLVGALSSFENILGASSSTSLYTYFSALAQLDDDLSKKQGTFENNLITHAVERNFVVVEENSLQTIAASTITATLSLKLSEEQANGIKVVKTPVLPTSNAMKTPEGNAIAYVLPANVFTSYDEEAAVSLTVPENVVVSRELVTNIESLSQVSVVVTQNSYVTNATGGICPNADKEAISIAITTISSTSISVISSNSAKVGIVNNLTNGALSFMNQEYQKGATLYVPVGSINATFTVVGTNGKRAEDLDLTGITGISKVSDNIYGVNTAESATISLNEQEFTVNVDSSFKIKANASIAESVMKKLTLSKSLATSYDDSITITVDNHKAYNGFNLKGSLYVKNGTKLIELPVTAVSSSTQNVFTFCFNDIKQQAESILLGSTTRTITLVAKEYVPVTAANIATIISDINSGVTQTSDLTFKLEENIPNLSTSIGTDQFVFNGVFDGNGKAIESLSINDGVTYDYSGVFRHLGVKGVVKNLTVGSAGATSTITNNVATATMGAIVGSSLGSVENCAVVGTINFVNSAYSEQNTIVGIATARQISVSENDNATTTADVSNATCQINGVANADILAVGKTIQQ